MKIKHICGRIKENKRAISIAPISPYCVCVHYESVGAGDLPRRQARFPWSLGDGDFLGHGEIHVSSVTVTEM